MVHLCHLSLKGLGEFIDACMLPLAINSSALLEIRDYDVKGMRLEEIL
jgi:hypothetical protein